MADFAAMDRHVIREGITSPENYVRGVLPKQSGLPSQRENEARVANDKKTIPRRRRVG
jgi:hypothetical protein